jgi:hypothetical protein
LFYEVHGPDSRDPGGGSPENLKTVTRGSLAVPAIVAKPTMQDGFTTRQRMQIRFLGAL